MDKKSILTWLLKFVPTKILDKLQNLPPWAYVGIVGATGCITALYNYYTGKGLVTEAAIMDYAKILILGLFGAKALPTTELTATDEFSPN